MTTSSRVERGLGYRGMGRFSWRRSSAPRASKVVLGAGLKGLLAKGLLGAGLLVNGCALFGQDSARCDQSVATVRQAIGFKDFASARTWREYSWKVCDERGVIATLDKEIVDAETAAAADTSAAKKKSAKLAKDRINAAQKLWRTFDAETAANRNEQALQATHQSATRLESGLEPTFAQQLRKYNDGEHQKRLAALKR